MTHNCPTCGQPRPDMHGLIFDGGIIYRNGVECILQPQEFEIVEFLRKKYPHVAKKEAILDYIYQLLPECDIPDNMDDILKVQVCRIRPRLAMIGLKIETLWGVGYRLVVDPMPERAAA